MSRIHYISEILSGKPTICSSGKVSWITNLNESRRIRRDIEVVLDWRNNLGRTNRYVKKPRLRVHVNADIDVIIKKNRRLWTMMGKRVSSHRIKKNNVNASTSRQRQGANPRILKDAIGIICDKPTHSPAGNNPSLRYRSKCKDRHSWRKDSHRHKWSTPKCQVAIYFIRNHHNPKLSCCLGNLILIKKHYSKGAALPRAPANAD